MKTLLLAGLLCLFSDGDRERGLKLYAEGRYAEAAKAFEAAIAAEGDSPELQYNLALCRWRAGELPGAEEAAEKMGAMSGDALHSRYQGLLGAVRHSESTALEQQGDAARQADLQQAIKSIEQALQKAEASRDCFARAGAEVDAAGSASRNLERELQRVAALRKKLDELKQELEKQKKDQDKKDDKDKQQQDKKDKQDQNDKDQQKSEPKPEPKPGEQGEQKPEPKPDEKPQDQKQQQGEQPKDDKQGESKPEPQPAEQSKDQPKEKRQDAPGEMQTGELSPEQKARMLDQLKQLDAQLQAYRARARSQHKPAEMDW